MASSKLWHRLFGRGSKTSFKENGILMWYPSPPTHKKMVDGTWVTLSKLCCYVSFIFLSFYLLRTKIQTSKQEEEKNYKHDELIKGFYWTFFFYWKTAFFKHCFKRFCPKDLLVGSKERGTYLVNCPTQPTCIAHFDLCICQLHFRTNSRWEIWKKYNRAIS